MASDASTETTLTGTMVCAKCKLHEADKCQNVLQVEKDGKTVNYYLTQNKVSKDFHPNICQNDGEKVDRDRHGQGKGRQRNAGRLQN